jgi:hypothetical protein
MATIDTLQLNASKEKFEPSSHFLHTVEYDEKAHTMDVTFHSGSKHRYLYVFPSTYFSFKQSPSHDAYYSRAIRGKLASLKLIDKNIGKQKSSPTQKIKKEHHLDDGLRKQRAHIERTVGTIARAYAAAD